MYIACQWDDFTVYAVYWQFPLTADNYQSQFTITITWPNSVTHKQASCTEDIQCGPQLIGLYQSINQNLYGAPSRFLLRGASDPGQAENNSPIPQAMNKLKIMTC